MKTIGDILQLNASRYPERTAILYRDNRYTYYELNQRINRLAHHLMELGVCKGDRVGFMFYNSNQFIEIFFATVKIGAIAVPLNFRMISREIKWSLDHMGCRVFAYGKAFSRQVDPIKEDLPGVVHLIYSGEDLPPAGEHHFETLTKEGVAEEPSVSMHPEDIAYCIFTGGTTGNPKAAAHTHQGFIYEALSINLRMRMWEPNEVSIIQIPMFHIGGLGLMRGSLLIGGMLILVDTLDPLEILRLIEKERATQITLLPPSTYIRLLDVPNVSDFDLSSVTGVGGSVGVLPKELMLRLLDTFPNSHLIYGYASTEMNQGGTTVIITRSMVESDSDKLKSIGMQLPLTEIKLVDDNGNEVPVGKPGEAIAGGPAIMKEYFNNPEETARVFKDGRLFTGDILRKDADGYFYFADRKKDMIKTGGENVYAPEVERVILSHRAVEICAVIGVPDRIYSESVMAVIKLRRGFSATEEEIVEHCKKLLSSYKKPRRIVFVDDFPMNDAGKIQKFRLREQYSHPLD